MFMCTLVCFYAPFEEGGAYCFNMSVCLSVRRTVGMSVSFKLVQLITQNALSQEIHTW